MKGQQMTEQTAIEDLLNEPTHQAEETFDVEANAAPEPEATPEPDAADAKVADEAKAGADDAVTEGDKKGLKPWMHARIKAEQDKAKAVEAERDQFRQELERVKAMQMQQQPVQQRVSQDEPGQLPAEYLRKLEVSISYAAKQYGEDEVQAAVQWAANRSQVDPDFNLLALYQASPAQFAVEEFKKSPDYKRFQTMKQLADYGYDMDAFIAAKLDASASAPANSAGVQSINQQRAMPTDLQKAGTGGPRGRGFTGPTPLSDLLNGS